jgi:protein O-GlcNAc transferase
VFFVFEGEFAILIVSMAESSVQYHLQLAIEHHRAGRLHEAEKLYRKVLAEQPEHVDAIHNLGVIAQQVGHPEGIVLLRRAIALKPDYVEAHNNLGSALRESGQLDEALAAYHQAIALKPGSAKAYNNLGNAMKDKGLLDEALEAYRHAIALDPGYVYAHSNLIYTMYFHPSCSGRMIRAEAERWNERHARGLASEIQPWTNQPDRDRQLRIGYISPNFRQHTNGLAMLPLLNSHDHSRYHITCYSDVQRPTHITMQCRQAADEWRDITACSDQEVAELVRRDRIDIFVDLVSHMANHRLLVFARKPAPVQVTYLGHQGTTGMGTMDYRLSDPHIDPPGIGDADYVEEIVRVPDCYLCFEPMPDSPPVNEPPVLRNGYITFGSLNSFCKVTPQVLELWARILLAVPGSRLILRCPVGESQLRVLHFFAQRGVDSSRVDAGPHWMSAKSYLQFHDRIDIYLDPFPHAGHTTSMDALWMGVPLVTLAGQTAVGRGGVFLLVNLGLYELIARDEEEYFTKAVGLAGDLPRLQAMRAAIRQRMEESPLMNVPRFARNIEAAYREMWRRWCDRFRSD